MGRIKKDHSGYRTLGIFKKYQQPSIEEKPLKPKSKKDTKRWCRGKIGVRHDFLLIKKVEFYTMAWSTSKCVNCGKKQIDTIKP